MLSSAGYAVPDPDHKGINDCTVCRAAVDCRKRGARYNNIFDSRFVIGRHRFFVKTHMKLGFPGAGDTFGKGCPKGIGHVGDLVDLIAV